MKKIAIVSGVLCVLVSYSANAQVSFNVDLGVPQPRYIEEPQPVYVGAPSYPAYYQHRHYHRDQHWHGHGGGDHHADHRR